MSLRDSNLHWETYSHLLRCGAEIDIDFCAVDAIDEDFLFLQDILQNLSVTSSSDQNVSTVSLVNRTTDSIKKNKPFDSLSSNVKGKNVINKHMDNTPSLQHNAKGDISINTQVDEEVEKEVANINTLQDLHYFVKNFTKCSISSYAKNVVFCDGNPNAKIMIIGEAPGEQEDLHGIPFCGKSGNLLDKMLHSIGLERMLNVYITNILFWRPPANRKPTNEEMKICKPIVEKHIALMQPKILLLFGSTALESVLQQDGITRLVGTMEKYSNKYIDYEIATFPMFHPSYLLRDPLKRRNAWNALLKIQQYCHEQNIL